MKLPGLSAASRWVRERYLLGAALRLAEERGAERRPDVERAVRSARAHREAARELSRPRHAASSLLLYRAALADYLAALSSADLGAALADAGADERDRDAALRAHAVDPGGLHELPFREAHAHLRALDRASEHLDRRASIRSVAAIRRSRAIRVAALGAGLAIAVVAVVAALRAPRNLALHRRVTASSTRYGSPAGLVNGSIEWGSFALHTQSGGTAWVMIDLESPHAIREVRLYNRGDSGLDDATGTRVELSLDGAKYANAGACGDLFTQVTPCRLLLDGTRARFVKLSHAGYLALSEVEILGTP